MARSRSSSSSSSSSSGSDRSATSDGEHQDARKYSASDVVAQLPSLWRYMRQDSSFGPDDSEGNGEVAEQSSGIIRTPWFRGCWMSTKSTKTVLNLRSPSSESLLRYDTNTPEARRSYLSTATRTGEGQSSKTCKSRLRDCWDALLVYLRLRDA
ncbi:hypothetical protein F4814DRAFT_6886 [Daldinia grandis]|nr:hypothetical protein F4814DRAFT_6886 [Daldinia grandis]